MKSPFVAVLAARIHRAILDRAKAQPDPNAYLGAALERIAQLQATPREDIGAELLKFSHDFGLSGPEMN